MPWFFAEALSAAAQFFGFGNNAAPAVEAPEVNGDDNGFEVNGDDNGFDAMDDALDPRAVPLHSQPAVLLEQFEVGQIALLAFTFADDGDSDGEGDETKGDEMTELGAGGGRGKLGGSPCIRNLQHQRQALL